MAFQNSVNNIFKNQPVTSTAISYTATMNDFIIGVSDNTAQRTITVPQSVASNKGKMFEIKDTAGTAGTAFPIKVMASTGNIDGQAQLLISVNYGSLTIFSDGAGAWWTTSVSTGGSVSAFTWSAVSTTSQTAVAQNGYYCTNAAATTITLPVASCPAGSVIEVVSTPLNTAGWTINCGTGQSIEFGNSLYSTSIASSSVGDSVRLLCTVPASSSAGTFVVLSAVGNLSAT